jgi:hypothetical protein
MILISILIEIITNFPIESDHLSNLGDSIPSVSELPQVDERQTLENTIPQKKQGYIGVALIVVAAACLSAVCIF